MWYNLASRRAMSPSLIHWPRIPTSSECSWQGQELLPQNIRSAVWKTMSPATHDTVNCFIPRANGVMLFSEVVIGILLCAPRSELIKFPCGLLVDALLLCPSARSQADQAKQ